MLTTFKFFGFLAGFLVVSLLGRAQMSARQPSYPLKSSGSSVESTFSSNTENLFNEVGIYPLDASELEFNNILELSAALSPAGYSDLDKVRSIYFWIAKNITYDDKGLEGNTLPSQSAEAIFANKRGVCEGFSNLFSELCLSAGIEARIITGYALDEHADRFQILAYPNHAWNAVKIDGQWRLLDVTWACFNRNQNPAATNDEEKIRYKLESNFLVSPEKFVRNHLPEDPFWQLIATPVQFDDFMDGNIELLTSDVSIDVNERISQFEALDSLDQEIAFCQRMVENDWNKVKEYRLGIAYYYKAQQLYRKLGQLQGRPRERMLESIDKYYEKSLIELEKLTPSDFGFDYGKELISTITYRKELFSLNN